MSTDRYMPTMWEITLSKGDACYLLAYTGRKSRSGMIAAMRHRAEHVARITGAESFTFDKPFTHISLDNGWKVAFSGRTQREAQHSELSYVGKVVA